MRKQKITRTAEQQLLLDQLKNVAEGLGQTLAPFCEVVVHDLLDPAHAIAAIYNNLSSRHIGGPATELGLARIADAAYPAIVANYANSFADGRQAKSTSIGIKDSGGQYIAALCINVDLTMFHGLQSVFAQFSRIDASHGANGGGPQESLDPVGADGIRRRIDEYAARLSSTPRALKAGERRALIVELREAGCLDVRRAMEIIAQHLGISRATVYSYAK
ncbi:DNA-binding protein [Massilia sp. Root351]|jgi:predicted transcriptional regulator YheO|uniref:helix-turn-helix transcriptional regulator n=1 Tax=Massilia sp. Root351 TaxID=1736522 RepID=UPI00070C2FEB|nr:helix-turn-helix transcriptional regulator [Massilia sp. Root351]KQV79861.1 DNA-binding protein [Massilia sp. Root351]